MSQEAGSIGGGIVAEVHPKMQLGSNDHDGATPAESFLTILFPDPAPPGASDYATTGGNWSWQIEYVYRDTVLGVIRSESVTSANDIEFVPISSADSPPLGSADDGAGGDGYFYRVTVFDSVGTVVDEWDVRIFGQDFTGTGPAGIEAINDSIRRIAGLLGYRQRVTYSNYSLGIPQDTLVELLNAAGAVLAEYNVKKLINDANAVIGEIHAWDATTYPGPI